MITDTWIESNARRTPKKDLEVYREWTNGLAGSGSDGTDAQGNPIPYGSGPHCVQVFGQVKRLLKVTSVLEIGFNRGHGSAIWLGLGCKVISTDVFIWPEGIRGEKHLTSRYSDERFTFYLRTELELLLRGAQSQVDLAFIDGDHSEEGVLKDIELVRNHAQWILFDDWLPKHGPGVQPAIEKSGLKLVAIFGTMALCHNSNEYE